MGLSYRANDRDLNVKGRSASSRGRSRLIVRLYPCPLPILNLTIKPEVSVCVFVLVCESYVVHPRPDLCTMVQKGDLESTLSLKRNATFWKLPFFWRRVYTSESGVIHADFP